MPEAIFGQREVQLSVDNRVWVRRADGRTYEAPPSDQRRDRTHLLVPLRRNGADLLAAGTLGLGGGPRHGLWDAATMKARGGVVGAALFADQSLHLRLEIEDLFARWTVVQVRLHLPDLGVAQRQRRTMVCLRLPGDRHAARRLFPVEADLRVRAVADVAEHLLHLRAHARIYFR